MVAVVKVETRAGELAIAEEKALDHKLANILAKIQIQTLGKKLADVQAKAVVDTLKDSIAEKVKTFYKTVGEAEAELLVNKVANRIAVIRVKTLGEKLTEVCRIRQLSTHCHRSRPRRWTTHWLKGKQGS